MQCSDELWLDKKNIAKSSDTRRRELMGCVDEVLEGLSDKARGGLELYACDECRPLSRF